MANNSGICLSDMGITEVLTAPQSPWQNLLAERLVGSIRRECLDRVIVLGEASATNPEKLLRLLSGFENSPCFSQGRRNNSDRTGAGGWRDRGNRAGQWPAPSLRTPRGMTDGNVGLRFAYIGNYILPRTKRALLDTLGRPDR